MDNEGSERPPKGGDQKGIGLAKFWLWRYIVEEKLGITDLSQIDPIAFSIWLMGRPTPSLGQKRNIFTAVTKYLGKNLLAILGEPREVSEIIKPSMETFNSTVLALRTFSDEKNIDEDHRYIRRLQQRGIETTTLNPASGLQERWGLSTILEHPEFEACFGKNVSLDLQALLVERQYSNLRNAIAHGIMHAGEFYQPPAVYMWWLTLRLCLTPFFKEWKEYISQDNDMALPS